MRFYSQSGGVGGPRWKGQWPLCGFSGIPYATTRPSWYGAGRAVQHVVGGTCAAGHSEQIRTVSGDRACWGDLAGMQPGQEISTLSSPSSLFLTSAGWPSGWTSLWPEALKLLVKSTQDSHQRWRSQECIWVGGQRWSEGVPAFPANLESLYIFRGSVCLLSCSIYHSHLSSCEVC